MKTSNYNLGHLNMYFQQSRYLLINNLLINNLLIYLLTYNLLINNLLIYTPYFLTLYYI